MKKKPCRSADCQMLALELSVAKKQLQHETVRRKAVDTALRKSRKHYSLLLEQSRNLSGQILLAQKEKRTLNSGEIMESQK